MSTAAPHKTFGQWLAEQREEAGYSRRALGRRLGYSHTAVELWEKDRGLPQAAMLPVIARVLGVAPSTVGRWLAASPLIDPPEGAHMGCRALPCSDLLKRLGGHISKPPFRPASQAVA